MQTNFDFSTNTLIIGGGPAGSTLAKKLAKNNINTILVEKNFAYDKPCGGGVKTIVFKEFNIPIELENKRINEFILFSPKNRATIDLSETPLSIVLRKEFDNVNRKIAEKNGAKLIEGRYKTLKHIDDYIIAQIKTKEKLITIKTKYLVGADGVTSSVRKDIIGSYPKAILSHYSNISSVPINNCEFHFGKKFAKKDYSWVFPHGDKLSVGTFLNQEKTSYKLFSNFKNSIVQNDNTQTKGFYIPLWQNKTLFYKNNVFFVGDAAGQVLPFTYEGIYYAIKSAEILADAIIEDKPELYEKNWNRKYKNKFKFFITLQKIFLGSNFMTEKMIKFFQNKQLQQSALKYWGGTAKPLNFGQAVLKILNHAIKN
ncbi:MAG: hypothetical protein C0625_08170 [Arcobacter sp.]|nr:MAG: hypothetical protein C0625_08170 [Arcobacter sp.]